MPDAGLVPASTDADVMKFLRGDGLWAIASSLVEMKCTYKGTSTVTKGGSSGGVTVTATKYLIEPPDGYTFNDVKVLFYVGITNSQISTAPSYQVGGSIIGFVMFDKDEVVAKDVTGSGIIIDNTADLSSDNSYRIGNGVYTTYLLSGTNDFVSNRGISWIRYNTTKDTLGVYALEGTEYFKAYALTI